VRKEDIAGYISERREMDPLPNRYRKGFRPSRLIWGDLLEGEGNSSSGGKRRKGHFPRSSEVPLLIGKIAVLLF